MRILQSQSRPSVIRLHYDADDVRDLFIYVDDDNSITGRSIIAYFRANNFSTSQTPCPSIQTWRRMNQGEILQRRVHSDILLQGRAIVRNNLLSRRNNRNAVPDMDHDFTIQGPIPEYRRPFMRLLLPVIIYEIERALRANVRTFWNPVTNNRSRPIQLQTLQSILIVYKVSLSLLEDDTTHSGVLLHIQEEWRRR